MKANLPMIILELLTLAALSLWLQRFAGFDVPVVAMLTGLVVVHTAVSVTLALWPRTARG